MTQDCASKPTWQGTFTNDELKCSIPFDDGRRLQGHTSAELFDEISSIIDSTEVRVRARKHEDQLTRDATIEALLANLLVAAFNRIEPQRFVAMPFSTSTYSQSGLSVVAMRAARDAMGDMGLLEGVRGFYRPHYMPGQEFARLTRLRATPALREIFQRCRVGRGAAKCSNKQVIRINKTAHGFDFTYPPDVAASADALLSINRRLASATLALPDEAWERIGAARNNNPDREMDKDPYVGDLTAISLYRSFKTSWKQGGRLYGGWWINLPKTERALITIDGDATTELDFSRLHPTLLFARQDLRLNFDPYSVVGLEGDNLRDMGKRTFGRLVNTPKKQKRFRQSPKLPTANPSQHKAKPIRLKAKSEDLLALPLGMTFPTYLNLLLTKLAPISKWFGSNAGMTLQREDSDLAISILERLDNAGVIALPVHDSFIVKQSEIALLHQVMTECFYKRYSFNPVIKPSVDHKLPGPMVA